jgi:hypothetical protein
VSGTVPTLLRTTYLETGARRVWLHTCTLDGPASLAHYRARGFAVYREEESLVDLPSTPAGCRPGAARPVGGAA